MTVRHYLWFFTYSFVEIAFLLWKKSHYNKKGWLSSRERAHHLVLLLNFRAAREAFSKENIWFWKDINFCGKWHWFDLSLILIRLLLCLLFLNNGTLWIESQRTYSSPANQTGPIQFQQRFPCSRKSAEPERIRSTSIKLDKNLHLRYTNHF